MKRECAKEALKYVKNGMTIGLGGGSTVAYLAQYLSERKMDVKIVTPSSETAALCKDYDLTVIPTCMAKEIEIAFDGCDEVDYQLQALKSTGAIHTREKIIAVTAKQYVILADESKVFETLPFQHPVTVELIPESLSHVEKEMKRLGGEPVMRKTGAKAGYVMSDDGNYIMDVAFCCVKDIEKLNQDLKMVTGVVETSLFVNIVSFALCAHGKAVRKIERR